jgi:hypothetical protein
MRLNIYAIVANRVAVPFICWCLYLIVAILVLNSPAQAQYIQDVASRAPLKIRNQFPLALPLLSFHADDAYLPLAGEFRMRIQYSQSNTFAKSPEFMENWDISDRRMFISPHRTTDNPNQYFIDTATGRMMISFSYGLEGITSLELQVPVLSNFGGFMDSPIEFIHEMTGLPNMNRTRIVKNSTQMYLSSDQDELYLDASDYAGPSLGDIVLIAKRKLFSEGNIHPAVALRVALKLPSGNAESLLSNGSVDYGLDLAATKSISSSFISTNFAVVLPGEWKALSGIEVVPFYSWILAYEFQWGQKLSLIAQHQGLPNTDLIKPLFEWTLGAKYDITTTSRLSFGITENYNYHENTADFGFHLGLEWIF